MNLITSHLHGDKKSLYILRNTFTIYLQFLVKNTEQFLSLFINEKHCCISSMFQISLFDQHQMLVVYLDLLQSACSFLGSIDNMQAIRYFWSSILDLYKFLKYFCMFSCHFYWLIKKFSTFNDNAFISSFGRKCLVCTALSVLSSKDKAKSLLTH